MTPDGLSGLLMLVILWSGGGWWCRQAWSTSRGIVEYCWEELGMETRGAFLACLVLWPVYRWRTSHHSW